MKGLVVYDSLHGNTKLAAEKIAAALGYKSTPVSGFPPERLLAYEHVIFGMPTHLMRPTTAMIRFVHDLPGGCLSGVRYSCFDTRLDVKEFMLLDDEYNLYGKSRTVEVKLPRPRLHPLPEEVEARLAKLEQRLSANAANHLTTPPSVIVPSHASGILALLLHDTGAEELGKPEGFIVAAVEGPLKEGELDRAMSWAEDLCR